VADRARATRRGIYTPFRTLPPEPVEGPRLAKSTIIQRISRSPRRILADAWSTISAVDAHARACKACNRRKHDPGLQITMGALLDPHLEPFQACRIANRLEAEERTARKAYMAAGHSLPVVKGLQSLLILAPLGLLIARAAVGVLA